MSNYVPVQGQAFDGGGIRPRPGLRAAFSRTMYYLTNRYVERKGTVNGYEWSTARWEGGEKWFEGGWEDGEKTWRVAEDGTLEVRRDYIIE